MTPFAPMAPETAPTGPGEKPWKPFVEPWPNTTPQPWPWATPVWPPHTDIWTVKPPDDGKDYIVWNSWMNQNPSEDTFEPMGWYG